MAQANAPADAAAAAPSPSGGGLFRSHGWGQRGSRRDRKQVPTMLASQPGRQSDAPLLESLPDPETLRLGRWSLRFTQNGASCPLIADSFDRRNAERFMRPIHVTTVRPARALCMRMARFRMRMHVQAGELAHMGAAAGERGRYSAAPERTGVQGGGRSAAAMSTGAARTYDHEGLRTGSCFPRPFAPPRPPARRR
jgi:hypothetical protein